MSDIKILRHSDSSEKKELFCLVGEYFASAEIKKELGESMISDDQYIWFVALKSDIIQGFAAVHPVKKNGKVDYLWVLPEYRKQSIGKSLLAAAVDYLESLDLIEVESIIAPEQLPMFQHFGFEQTGQRGRYLRMRKLCKKDT